MRGWIGVGLCLVLASCTPSGPPPRGPDMPAGAHELAVTNSSTRTRVRASAWVEPGAPPGVVGRVHDPRGEPMSALVIEVSAEGVMTGREELGTNTGPFAARLAAGHHTLGVFWCGDESWFPIDIPAAGRLHLDVVLDTSIPCGED